jgi:hypothetical protein
VVFITAPTSQYRLGVPDYLENQGFVPNKAAATTLHRQYNEIVRDVATGDGVFLLDLEAETAALPAEGLGQLFMKDGIHFTDKGLETVAIRIARFAREELPKAGPLRGDR